MLERALNSQHKRNSSQLIPEGCGGCVFNGDIEVANDLLKMTNVIRNELERQLIELPEIPILRIVILELARIADTGAGIAVIAINKAVEKSSELCGILR